MTWLIYVIVIIVIAVVMTVMLCLGKRDKSYALLSKLKSEEKQQETATAEPVAEEPQSKPEKTAVLENFSLETPKERESAFTPKMPSEIDDFEEDFDFDFDEEDLDDFDFDDDDLDLDDFDFDFGPRPNGFLNPNKSAKTSKIMEMMKKMPKDAQEMMMTDILAKKDYDGEDDEDENDED